MQILILGMHRSGTSVVTGLVQRMGAYFGPEELSIGASEENPTGFFERTDSLAINDTILTEAGLRWDDVRGMETAGISASEETKKAIRTQLAEMNAHLPWVLKDPRLCITLPAWKSFLENPVAVIVHRDPLEIARSLEKRNGIPLLQGVALWEHHLVAALNASRDMPRIFVQYGDVVSDPYGVADALHESLSEVGKGLAQPTREEIEALVQPGYYRSRVADGLSEEMMSPGQKRLLAFAMGQVVQETALAVSETGRHVAQDYHAHLHLNDKIEALTLALGQAEQRIFEVTGERDRANVRANAAQVDLDAILTSRTWRWANGLRRGLLRG